MQISGSDVRPTSSYLTSASISGRGNKKGFEGEKHECNFPLGRLVNNGDRNKFSTTLKKKGEK